MLFRFVVCIVALIAAGAPARAQQQPQSLDTITVGPWEMVAWGDSSRQVQYCTMIRVKTPTGDPSYGLLIDRQGTLFSVDTSVWSLPGTPTPIDAGVAPVTGRAYVLQAIPVSRRRANIDLTGHPDVVAELRDATEVEVSITGIIVRLPFDGYAAARPIHEACVQHLGRELPRQR